MCEKINIQYVHTRFVRFKPFWLCKRGFSSSQGYDTLRCSLFLPKPNFINFNIYIYNPTEAYLWDWHITVYKSLSLLDRFITS